MKRAFMILGLLVAVVFSASFCLAQEHHPKVGGFEQLQPGENGREDIGAGWGHRSMTYGVMNLMSGMTTQVASILRSGKATPEMVQKLSHILDHIAEMLNYAPAYMMGTKAVDSDMVKEMQGMLKDLERMRKEVRLN